MNTVSTTATAYKNIAVFDPVFTIFWCLILKVGIKGAIVEFAGSGEYAVGCGEADFVFVAAHAFYFDVAQPRRAVGVQSPAMLSCAAMPAMPSIIMHTNAISFFIRLVF